jgi:hypothetical protein
MTFSRTPDLTSETEVWFKSRATIPIIHGSLAIPDVTERFGYRPRRSAKLQPQPLVLNRSGVQVGRRFTRWPLVQARASPQPLRVPEGIDAGVSARVHGTCWTE